MTAVRNSKLRAQWMPAKLAGMRSSGLEMLQKGYHEKIGRLIANASPCYNEAAINSPKIGENSDS
jgi:hypothetical protein